MKGLYAITDSSLIAPGELETRVAEAIDGGAVTVQYRDKQRSGTTRLAEAAALARLCESRSVPLLVNDDVELARATGAAGVHIGKTDTSLAEARRILGASAVIGVSCYNRIELARDAVAGGADYVAFGRFFASQSKPDAVQATVEMLQQARRELALPIVAIGGITPDNGAALVAAGADQLAVIHGVFGQPDVCAAAKAYSSLFD